MLIFLLTFALPQIGQSVLTNLLVPGALATPLSPVDSLGTEERAAFTAGALIFLLVTVVVTVLVSALGWAAGIWTVTQNAADQPADLASAFAAAFRRVGPMSGWYLLYALMVGVGLVACVLPGLYLAVAGSLFSFVVVFERGRNPIGRSFWLVHKAFGQVLGRVALLAVAALGVSCVVGLCTGAAGAAIGEAGIWLGDIVTALLVVPIAAVALVGLLLTYTQARAGQEPVSTAALWAAANQDSNYPGQGYPGQGHPGQGYPGQGPGGHPPGY